FIGVVLVHAIDRIDHNGDQGQDLFAVDQVVYDGGQLGTAEVFAAIVHVEGGKAFGSGCVIAGRKVDVDAPLVVQQFALVVKFLGPPMRDSRSPLQFWWLLKISHDKERVLLADAVVNGIEAEGIYYPLSIDN